MDSNLTILQITALAIAAVCAIIDLRTKKIPNVITFPTTLAGIVLNFIFHSWPGVVNSVMGAALGIGITILPKWKKLKRAEEDDPVGYGDVKLMMALGALLGWADALIIYFYFSLLWGGFAVVQFVRCLPLKHLIGGLLSKQVGGSMFSAETAKKIQDTMRKKIPLGQFFAIAVLLGELFRTSFLQFVGFTAPPAP